MVYTKDVFDSETKSAKTKKMGQMYYPLSQLYYALVDDCDYIICETYVNHRPRFTKLVNISDYTFVNKIIDDSFTIKKSLKEEIDDKKINVCILTSDGKEKSELTVTEIINLLKIMSLLENKSFDSLNELCISIANKISDLLGININCNPSSKLRIRNVEEIAVPATKVLKFKNLLFNYIKISMALDGRVTVSNNDYRILRALKGARIKTPEIENEFTITVKCNGEEILECNNVEQVLKSSKTFQKINKYKKA